MTTMIHIIIMMTIIKNNDTERHAPVDPTLNVESEVLRHLLLVQPRTAQLNNNNNNGSNNTYDGYADDGEDNDDGNDDTHNHNDDNNMNNNDTERHWTLP